MSLVYDHANVVLEKREFLLYKEMQHRMKNNLQLILSLINIQIDNNIHQANKDFLISLKHRIQSISLTNNLLEISSDCGKVDLKGLAENLADTIDGTYNVDNNILLLRHFESIKIEQKLAIPFGLILNELLTNAYKYAFSGVENNKSKRIEVILRKDKGNYLLMVSDNGKSMRKIPDLAMLKSSGLKLVYALTEQLSGNCEINLSEGTSVTITF